MPTFVIAYGAAALTMLVLDVIWLSQAVPRIYKPQLGDLLAEQPNFAIAAVFYLVYLIGVVVFAILPAVDKGSWTQALLMGGLLGLVAYGTYDFTNLATLRGWPLGLSLIDVVWGVVLTATVSTAGYLAVRWFA